MSSDLNIMNKELIASMCGPLMNSIKICMQLPSKNRSKAANADLKNCINLLGEKLLPKWCHDNENNG